MKHIGVLINNCVANYLKDYRQDYKQGKASQQHISTAPHSSTLSSCHNFWDSIPSLPASCLQNGYHHTPLFLNTSFFKVSTCLSSWNYKCPEFCSHRTCQWYSTLSIFHLYILWKNLLQYNEDKNFPYSEKNI